MARPGPGRYQIVITKRPRIIIFELTNPGGRLSLNYPGTTGQQKKDKMTPTQPTGQIFIDLALFSGFTLFALAVVWFGTEIELRKRGRK